MERPVAIVLPAIVAIPTRFEAVAVTCLTGIVAVAIVVIPLRVSERCLHPVPPLLLGVPRASSPDDRQDTDRSLRHERH